MFVNMENNTYSEMVINNLIDIFKDIELDGLKRKDLQNIMAFIDGIQQYLDSIKQRSEKGQILLDVNEITDLLVQARVALMCTNSI